MAKLEDYQRVCTKIKETLLKDEMTAIMVQLKIDRATRQSVTDGGKFIDVLEMREVIGVGNFHRLIPLLRDHELDHVAGILENYMTEYESGDEPTTATAATLASIPMESNFTKSAGEVSDDGAPVMFSASFQNKATFGASNAKTSTGEVPEEGGLVMFPASFQAKKEAAVIKRSLFCEKHKAREEAICLDCSQHTCYACAYNNHQGHKVVTMDELEANIQDQTKEIKSEIGEIKKQLECLENVQKVLEEKKHHPFELELQTFLEESLEAMQTQQQRFVDSVNDISELGVTDLEHTQEELSDVENMIFLSEGKIKTKLYTDNLTKLCELNKVERKVTEYENRLKEISHHLKDGSMEVSIRPTSVSASLAHVSYGCILGAVMVNAEQMVVIRNQENPIELIEITCNSCFDPKILFWKYDFKCKVDSHPVVIANTLHVAPRKMAILVGCGRSITILRVTEPHNLLFFVEKTSDTLLSIPNDSHITGLAPITGKMQDAGIIVSDKTSGMLQIFDNKYQLTKKVKCPGHFPLVTCVFRDNVYKYAVSGLDSKSVELMTTKSTEERWRQFGTLTNLNFHAQSLFFDGTFFTVLWVSEEETYSEGQNWQVIAYKIDGKECNVSKAGKCDPNVTVVSISHVKNETLLCFSNGTVELFQTYKT